MVKAYQVKSCFDTLIVGNNKAVSTLQTALQETRADKMSAHDVYKNLLEQSVLSLLVSLDKEKLKKLEAVLDIDYAAEYEESLKASRDAEARIAEIEKVSGKRADLNKQYADLSKSLEGNLATWSNLLQSINRGNTTLTEVYAFDRQAKAAGKQSLEEGSIDYFSSKKGFSHVIAWMFNGHYREGRSLINDFKQKGGDITAVRQEVAAAKKKSGELSSVIEKNRAELDVVTSPIEEIGIIASRITSEQAVIESIKNDILKECRDKKTFGKIAAALPETFTPYLVQMRAKAELLGKLEDNVQGSIANIQAGTAQLQKNLPNISKAANKNSKKDIDIDLEKIRKKCEAAQALAQHNAREIRKQRKSIREYAGDAVVGTAYVASEVLDVYVNMMIIDMIFNAGESGLDLFSLNSTIGIPLDVATETGLALDNLTPDLSADIAAGDISPDLAETFNDLSAVDIEIAPDGTFVDMDIPDADFSMPDISMPDIDMGDAGGGFLDAAGDAIGGLLDGL